MNNIHLRLNKRLSEARTTTKFYICFWKRSLILIENINKYYLQSNGMYTPKAN